MKCLNCQKEFISKRSTAKFDTVKCKLAYHRGLSVSDSVSKPLSVSEESDTVKKEVARDNSFTPNWKRKGYASAHEGILATMAALAQNSSLEGQVFHLGNVSFEVRNSKMQRIA